MDEDESSPDAEEKGPAEDSEPEGVQDTSAEAPAAREPKSEL